MMNAAENESGLSQDLEVYLSLDTSPQAIAVEAMEQAEQRLDAVEYKFTDPVLAEQIMGLLGRGVEIRILLDEREARKREGLWSQVLREGAEVRFWPTGELGKLHVKLLLIDERRALTGSANWTRNAAEGNVELMVSTEEPEVVRSFRAVFDRLWAMGRPPSGRP